MPYKLPLMEIFAGIQGEGLFTGDAVIFVRFAGCNLACPWCDTKNSWTKEEATDISEDDLTLKLIEMSKETDIDTVVFTGGEPLLYNLSRIVRDLQENGIACHVETNGTLPTKASFDWITVSPKPNEFFIDPTLNVCDIKLVVDDVLTLEKVLEIYEEHGDIAGMFLLQPEANNFAVSVEKAAAWVLKHPKKFVLGAQMHKYWGIK